MRTRSNAWLLGAATFCGVGLFTACGSALAQPAAQAAPVTSADPGPDRQRRLKEVKDIASADEARLIAVFKQVHANPELAFEEHETSALVVKEFKALGFEVHAGIAGTGVVGILRNGPGPVVMFRSDMDALPLKEETDLSYRSVKVVKGPGGAETPVAHSCGHDAHVAWLLGIAKVMANLKSDWSGTLVLVAQPAEESTLGATAMVEAGLYKFTPKPAYLIASHIYPTSPAGTITAVAGRRMAGSDQMDVVIRGVGGHASMPQAAKDPVVFGAQAVLDYQTIISRHIDPQEPAVLTVGAFQSGTTNNIIPNSATLKISLRWFDLKTRQIIIDAVKRMTDAVATAAGLGADLMPTYVMKGHSDAVINDADSVARAIPALEAALGADNILRSGPPVMASEDFEHLASPYSDTKILFLGVGGGAPTVRDDMKRGVMPAMNHSPKFQIDPAAIKSAVIADSMVMMEFLRQ